MGLVVSAIAAGIGSAAEGKKFDNLIFGSGKRGCNGRRSKSYSNVNVPAKYKCRHIDRIEFNLAPEKYTEGKGYYLRDPRHSITNDNNLLLVENCKIPNSCRRNCTDLDRWWRGVKKQFTHLNTQGMARRLITSGCAIKDDGTSCMGVPCIVYHKISKELHDQHGAAIETAWGRAIADFQRTGLGQALGFVPIIGSTMELLFKDISGKRPTAGDWISFGVDVLAAVAPGLGFLGAASKVGKVAAMAARQGFRNAKVAFSIGSSSAARIAAKTVVLSITKNPLVRETVRKAAYRQMAILSTRGGLHGVAYALRSNGEPYLTGLTEDQQAQVASTVETMIHNQERKAMAAILKEIDNIPFSVYKKFKTKAGKDIEVSAALDKLSKARLRIEAATTPAERKKAADAFAKLKDSSSGDVRRQSIKLGYERPITGSGSSLSAALWDLVHKNGVLTRCVLNDNTWVCKGRQYRIKLDNGKWSAWGAVGWGKKVIKQIRDAEEAHYGVSRAMSDRRWLKKETAKVGAIQALKNFQRRARTLAAKIIPSSQKRVKPKKSVDTTTAVDTTTMIVKSKQELKELKKESEFKGRNLKPLGYKEDKFSETYKNRYSDRNQINDSINDPRKKSNNKI